MLGSQARRALIIAIIGAVVCLDIFGVNIVALLTAPMAITMSAKTLKVKGDHNRAGRILSWLAITVAAISVIRPFLW